MWEEIRIYKLKAIKYAWQRVVRGYDERIMWRFSDYFNRCIPALKKFCEQQIAEDKAELNPKQISIYKETLKKIKAFEEMPADDYYKHPNQESELWEFAGKHLGYYWD